MKWLNLPALISAAIMFATTGEATWALVQTLAKASKDGRLSVSEKTDIRNAVDVWLSSFPEEGAPGE
tara:strand:- start:387 stop:587 length:201 start_codon:yes stop_codon:yes gene_type:complete